MSTVSEPADAGKVTDPTLIDVMERNVKALVRMSAVLVRLSARIDALEKKPVVNVTIIEGEDEPEPVTSRNTDPTGYVIPPLALLSDGRVLLHLSELDGASLVTFERWEGVILSEPETADVMDHLSHGMSEAAGMVGGWLLKRTGKVSKEDDEGGES